MKSLFVNNGTRIPEVFGADTIAALTAEAGLDPKVYTKADILANPALSADADYLFSTWGMPKFTEDEIARCFPRLKAVFYAAGTVQAFARPFLNRGIRIFSAWAANAVPVAEYTIAQILLANTGYFQACARFSQGLAHHRSAQQHAASFPGNYGCKVGLIGVGMIGAMVAERLKAYHLDVLAFDPFLSDARAAELGVRKVPLEVLFAECQTISNHLANNPQTVGMLNRICFDRMKPNAVFLNTGRGAQVVESDLCRALTEQPERTAVLDVTFPEPPEDHSPLYTLPNVFLTPHIAGSKGDEVRRMSEYMLEQFRNITAGRPVRWEVDLNMLETMA